MDTKLSVLTQAKNSLLFVIQLLSRPISRLISQAESSGETLQQDELQRNTTLQISTTCWAYFILNLINSCCGRWKNCLFCQLLKVNGKNKSWAVLPHSQWLHQISPFQGFSISSGLMSQQCEWCFVVFTGSKNWWFGVHQVLLASRSAEIWSETASTGKCYISLLNLVGAHKDARTPSDTIKVWNCNRRAIL